jgi:hypothetical protein
LEQKSSELILNVHLRPCRVCALNTQQGGYVPITSLIDIIIKLGINKEKERD